MESFALWENTPLLLEGEENPQIHRYPAENRTHSGTVLIFPGGGYIHRMPYEGEAYAQFLNRNGFDAYVVDYRVLPYRFPTELLDARRAVRFVRAHAEEFGIDPEKIAVMGSSAGGNLAALLCTCDWDFPEEHTDAIDDLPYMPDAQIHCYSYISFSDPVLRFDACTRNILDEKDFGRCADLTPEDHVKDNTPQAFFFHTSEDPLVHVGHALKFAAALHEKGIRSEVHVFPDGNHGLGLGDRPGLEHPHVVQWGGLLINWLSYLGF